VHLESLALLLVSALFHAVSQALIKGSRDKRLFAWLMMGASALPVPFILPSLRGVPPAGWACLGASGLLEALYFSTLTKAYSLGDFSSVYPVARGSAPLFTLAWATVLLRERPSAAGLGGILLVTAGIYLVNLPSLSARDRLAPFRAASGPWALATGVLISCYTTVDKLGMRHFPPLAYLSLVLGIAFLAMAPAVLSRPEGRAALAAELGWSGASKVRCLDIRAAGRVLAAAAMGFVAYSLVLTALARSPASYVAAAREISVVIGAWIGVRFLGERGGALRVAAAALIVAGVVAIALTG